MSEAKAMEAVWRERAERLSERLVSSGPALNAFPVLVLGIGKERYGINLAEVAEVLPPLDPTPVPGAAAVFAGVINVHGEIRPLIDLGRYLGIERSPETVPDGHARVILLRKDGREMGLQIDSVEQIRWIGAGDLEAGGSGEAGRPQHIKGWTKDLLMLFGAEGLFALLQPTRVETGVET
jgi:purine-binding chemotaxis protein CheW